MTADQLDLLDVLAEPYKAGEFVWLESLGSIYRARVWRDADQETEPGCIVSWHDGRGKCQSFVPAAGDEYRRILGRAYAPIGKPSNTRSLGRPDSADV